MRPVEAILVHRWSSRRRLYRMMPIQPPQPMALEIGSRLGHYAVTALIGEGGMGQVYQPARGSTTTWSCRREA